MAGPVCVQCGQPLAESARFCGDCGATQPAAGARTLPSAGVSPGAATMFDHGPPAALKSTVLGTMSPLPAAPPPPAAVPLNKQTMIGVASPLASAVATALATAPAPAPAPPVPVAHKTMLGVASPLGAQAFASPPAAPAPPAPAPVPAPVPAPAPLVIARPQPSPEPPKRSPVMTVALQVAYVPPPAALPELKAPPPRSS